MYVLYDVTYIYLTWTKWNNSEKNQSLPIKHRKMRKSPRLFHKNLYIRGKERIWNLELECAFSAFCNCWLIAGRLQCSSDRLQAEAGREGLTEGGGGEGLPDMSPWYFRKCLMNIHSKVWKSGNRILNKSPPGKIANEDFWSPPAPPPLLDQFCKKSEKNQNRSFKNLKKVWVFSCFWWF